MLACDIQNADLTADCSERVLVEAGPKFGSEAGNNILVRKSPYVLKSSGEAFRALLLDTLYEMGYMPVYAELDFWLRLAVKPDS